MTFRIWIVFILLMISLRIHPGILTGNDDRYPVGMGGPALIDDIQEKYQALKDTAVNPDAFRYGMEGYRSLSSRGFVQNDSLLTIIDFSKPSVADRFFVINLNQSAVVYKSLVSHGRNSGDLYATQFSNKIHSYQSALGFYITGQPYMGSKGYSLRLTGLDTGYNDRSWMRSIVIHAAIYVTKEYILRYGRPGRSLGCPALPPAENARIINTIKCGSVVFGYFPDMAYLQHSVVLHQD